MDYRLLWSCFLYLPLAFKSGHSQNTSVQNTTQSFSTVGQTSLTPGSSYAIHATVANASNVSLTTMHSSSTTVSTSKKVSNITLFLNASNINNHFSTPSNSVSSNYSISETTPAYFIPSSKQPLSTYNTQYATSLKLATSYLTATRTTTTPRKTATSTTDTVSLTTLTRISTATPPIDTIYTTTSTPTTLTSAALTDTMYNSTITTLTSTSTITTSTPHATSTLTTTTSTSTFTSTTPTAAPNDTIMRNYTITTLTITSTSTNPQTTTHYTTSTDDPIISAITSTPAFTTSSQTSFITLVVSSKSTSTYSFTIKPNSTQSDSPTTVATTTTLQSSAGESVTTKHSPSSTTARLTISTLVITPSPPSTAKIATSIDSTSKIVLPFTTESVVTILSTVKHTMSTISPTKAAGTTNKSTISASYFATKPTPGSPSITKHKSTIHTITSVTKPTEISSMTGATVSIATEPATTGGTTNIPKVFFVIASINLEWNAHYGIRYTEESKKLKDQLETALQKELKVLDRFIGILIIRFFKGSVKFESEVYFNQSSTVNEESLSTKIESTDIGKLGKIEVIKVERNKDNTSTVQNSKPLLQPWMIVAMAAGAVVLIYTIILIILMVKFRRLKRQSTTSLTRSRSSTFFNMALVNNNCHGIAVEDNEIETFSFRKTSTIERPELQTFASIEEASDDKKDGGNDDATSNHDNHIPVMTFNAGSDSSGSINESKEKDDVSEQTDSEADDEMDEDEVKVKKEKEPEPGEKDRLVEKESNVSPFY